MADQLLLSVYTAAEEACRAKIRMIKLKKEKKRIQNLEFYKKLIQQNMSSQQVKALQMTFHVKQFQI